MWFYVGEMKGGKGVVIPDPLCWLVAWLIDLGAPE